MDHQGVRYRDDAARQITESFEELFEDEVMERGESILMRGAVLECSLDDGFIHATVAGTHCYDVEIDLCSDDMSCSCPYFDRELEPCKHIWAALCAAVDEGLLNPGDLPQFRLGLTSPADGRAWSGTTGAGKQDWARRLDQIGSQLVNPGAAFGDCEDLLCVIDAAQVIDAGYLLFEICRRPKRADGTWGTPRPARFTSRDLSSMSRDVDQRFFGLLAALCGDTTGWSGHADFRSIPPCPRITSDGVRPLVQSMCETGRARLRRVGSDDIEPLHWDDGPPWKIVVQVELDPGKECYVVGASFERCGERVTVSEPDLILADGLLFLRGKVATIEDSNTFFWAASLRQKGRIEIPVAESEGLLHRLVNMTGGHSLELPDSLRIERIEVRPTPVLLLSGGGKSYVGTVLFEYGGPVIEWNDQATSFYNPEERQVIRRDRASEQTAFDQLATAGVRFENSYRRGASLVVARRQLMSVARDLIAEGWHVQVDERALVNARDLSVEVRSGIDWFELHGTADFGGISTNLPELLAALERGDETVRLDDRTSGLIPEEWVRRYKSIAGLGREAEDHIQFTTSQVGLLDAMLAARPEATCDAVFAKARRKLARFDGIKPRREPAGFKGELRDYQRAGLGWLHFLREYDFGGCLADDMGLGKTVQILALLESRRTRRGERRPSLAVVPRSLVHHWKSEASRFVPRLRVHDHTGTQRLRGLDPEQRKSLSHFDDRDLIVTTYGTLRRDVALLSAYEFDYVILDEAQAIKNARTASAKAARLLRAQHRLAVSGTPIENHVGELFSLFSFVQPGLFENDGTDRRVVEPDDDTCRLLGATVRPFMLRRTKEQVATDLPPKVEQDLFCDLAPKQRREYDELRDHYRASLLQRVDADGLDRSKMHVLEALLRLRQAACHPGLIDKARSGAESAKLKALLGQLEGATVEGHKALVFSQFTQFLGLVRPELDRMDIGYEYLDGRTRKRAAKVDRFQEDPECRVFLVSLKAGGVGLNLTAADYVFLLDPWWNPAVEAQAIDRTHRIGQTSNVFAYRLIARDTVEERIRELQDRKRGLADAIVRNDGSLLRELNREDLERLLS